MNTMSMLDYIMDQPRAITELIDKKNATCDPFKQAILENEIKRIYLVGSGTSNHVCEISKFYFEKYLNIECTVCLPTTFANYTNINLGNLCENKNILVVGISQSGTSVSTINALKKARDIDCITMAFTADSTSLLTECADYIVPQLCGREAIPIETRGFSIQVLTTYLWVIETAYAIKYIGDSEYDKLLNEVHLFAENTQQILDESIAWFNRNEQELVKLTKGFIGGYGINYGTILEGALKVGETYHKPIQAFELEELLHGREMATDKDTFYFLIGSEGIELGRVVTFRDFLYEETSHVFIITANEMPLLDHDLKLSINTTSDLSPLLYTLPLQIIAGYLCKHGGKTPEIYPLHKKSPSHKRD